MDWGKKWLVDFNAGKTQLVWFDRSNNNGSIDVKMDGSILEEKSSFKMLGLTFSSKLDWGPYIISIAKIASKKIGALIRSMKFLSPEVALYLYKSTILSCMENCCHALLVAPVATWILLDFSVTIHRCYKDVYVNSFFPRTAKLWNSLPIECFPLTYDFSGFKSRINRHLLTVGSF